MNNIKARDMQVFEILREISELEDTSQKIKTIREKYYDHTPLHRVLKMNYCDSIVPMVPEGMPPINSNNNPDGPNHSSLWEYIRVFPVIVKSAQSVKMKPLQIERMFIEMLEAIDPNEAEILCLAKDKNLEDQFDISINIVKEALPSLNIQREGQRVVKIKTPEEQAEQMLDEAKAKKVRAKVLNNEAAELIKKAKALTV
jgi:hypothetical protein